MVSLASKLFKRSFATPYVTYGHMSNEVGGVIIICGIGFFMAMLIKILVPETGWLLTIPIMGLSVLTAVKVWRGSVKELYEKELLKITPALNALYAPVPHVPIEFKVEYYDLMVKFSLIDRELEKLRTNFQFSNANISAFTLGGVNAKLDEYHSKLIQTGLRTDAESYNIWLLNFLEAATE